MPQLTRQSSNGPVLFQLLSASSDEACVHTRTHLHHMGALLQSNLSASFTSVNPQEGRLLPEVTYRGSKARRAVIVTSAAQYTQPPGSTRWLLGTWEFRSHSLTHIHTHIRG